jgi:predicted ester cyclase
VDNVEIIRRLEEGYAKDDLSVVDQYIAEDFVAHAPGAEMMPPGREGPRTAHMGAMRSFPDHQTTIEDLFGEGDYVVAHVRMKGTNTGGLAWAGVPANDKKVDFDWITIYRLENGKAVETWAQMDVPMLMQQLGAMPAPGM